MFRNLSLLCAVACFPSLAMAAEGIVWIEGEQAVKRELVDNAGLNDVNPDELSGGKWICSFSHENEPTGTAEYTVEIPEAGDYHLWVRAAGGTGLSYRLDDVDITCGNAYASITVVSLDDKPIRESERLLVQAGTLSRPTGWTAMPTRARIDGKQSDCFRILSVGKMPMQVENIEAVLTIANPRLSKATLLDSNGMATATPVDIQQVAGKATIRLPANTIYLMLQ